MSEFTPVTTIDLPEAPYQPVEVILSNLQRLRIYARFARNMSLPVTAYRRIEGIKKPLVRRLKINNNREVPLKGQTDDNR